MGKRLTTKDFARKSNIVHNNKYIYEDSVYTTARDTIQIRCPFHGLFTVLASGHLQGQGYTKCSKKILHNANGIEFFEKAKKVHNNRYVYDDSVYVNMRTKIKIYCNDHGFFKQLPSGHLTGKGCRKCWLRLIKSDQDSFVTNANMVHNNTYIYDDSVYINARSMIDIVCRIHGKFTQIAGNHLKGMGCQKCANLAIPTLEELITRFNEVHNNKYIYDETVYKNARQKL